MKYYQLRIFIILFIFLIIYSVDIGWSIRTWKISGTSTLSGNSTRARLGRETFNGFQFWEHWRASLPLSEQLFNLTFNATSEPELSRIVLDIRDDQGSMELMASHYYEFLSDPDVIFCLGPISTDFAILARSILDNKKMLLQTAGAGDLVSVGSMSTFNFIVPTHYIWRSGFLQARLAGATSFAYIAEDEPFDQQLCLNSWTLGPEIGIGVPVCNFTVPMSTSGGTISPRITRRSKPTLRTPDAALLTCCCFVRPSRLAR